MNYPNKIKKVTKKHDCSKINHSNRGMNLEYDLELTNKYYKENKIALVYKKETPIKVTKIKNICENKAIIKEGFFQKKSTTDYNGVYKGFYIDFEAKETKNKLFFPIKNIHKHQIEHIRNVIDNNGISFVIVCFSSLNKVFFINGIDIINYIVLNDYKNIQIEWFDKYGILIEQKYNPRIDYIKIVDNILEVK